MKKLMLSLALVAFVGATVVTANPVTEKAATTKTDEKKKDKEKKKSCDKKSSCCKKGESKESCHKGEKKAEK